MDNTFEPISSEEWKNLIIKELKTKTYDEVTWEIAEGVSGKPDYTSKDLAQQVVFIPEQRSEEGWLIKESLEIINFDETNKTAQNLLMQGVNAIRFHGHINRFEDLQTLFTGIELPHIGVFFSKQHQPLQFLNHFRDYLRTKNYPAEIVRGGMSFDPIGTLATRGNWINNEIRDRELFNQLLNASTEANLHQFHPVLVDGSIYHNSGADVVTELACTLAHGNEYLQWLQSEDQDLKKSAAHLSFKLAAGRKYFATMAKFRAFRPLWANVCAAYEIPSRQAGKVFISGETSRRERSLADRYTNLIRTTTQAMSAIIGGCDALNVVPFDAETQQADGSGVRLARNIQLILHEESFLGTVADPVAGSYALDKVTLEIMNRAWEMFCEIEASGGFTEGLKSGKIQSIIRRQAEKADTQIASGETVYVGLNKYPDPLDEDFTLDEKKSSVYESQQIEPLPVRTATRAYHSSQNNSAK